MFTSFKPAIAVLKLPALLVSAARGACVAERFAGAHPSQRSWAPSAHKAADGHAFRRHMRPELFASQGFAHAFIPSGVDSRGFPRSLLHRDLRVVVLRLHLPEEELDGVLHEAGDGHRTYAARNWGNY